MMMRFCNVVGRMFSSMETISNLKDANDPITLTQTYISIPSPYNAHRLIFISKLFSFRTIIPTSVQPTLYQTTNQLFNSYSHLKNDELTKWIRLFMKENLGSQEQRKKCILLAIRKWVDERNHHSKKQITQIRLNTQIPQTNQQRESIEKTAPLSIESKISILKCAKVFGIVESNDMKRLFQDQQILKQLKYVTHPSFPNTIVSSTLYFSEICTVQVSPNYLNDLAKHISPHLSFLSPRFMSLYEEARSSIGINKEQLILNDYLNYMGRIWERRKNDKINQKWQKNFTQLIGLGRIISNYKKTLTQTKCIPSSIYFKQSDAIVSQLSKQISQSIISQAIVPQGEQAAILQSCSIYELTRLLSTLIQMKNFEIQIIQLLQRSFMKMFPKGKVNDINHYVSQKNRLYKIIGQNILQEGSEENTNPGEGVKSRYQQLKREKAQFLQQIILKLKDRSLQDSINILKHCSILRVQNRKLKNAVQEILRSKLQKRTKQTSKFPAWEQQIQQIASSLAKRSSKIQQQNESYQKER